MVYFFILGSNPSLSTLELINSPEIKKLNPEFLGCSDKILLIKTNINPNAQNIIKNLGGTVKFGKILENLEPNHKKISDFIIKNISTTKKIFFGISFYDKKLYKKYNSLGRLIKKNIKEKEFPVRWVTSRDKNLSSVVVKKNKLLSSQGIELIMFNCLINTHCNASLQIGQTLAIQDFEDYSRRDYGRPARDSLSGMIPPKLAKIMLNISGVNTEKTILDPFCGSGTILTEALLMGYKNIIGSDKSKKAIEDSKKNLAWILNKNQKSRKLEQLKSENGNQVLFNLDVRNLSTKIKPFSIDAIITEPYLGPPLRGNENETQISKNIKELEGLYINTFKEFKKVLKPNGRVVIILPAFRIKTKILYLEILNNIKKTGFKIADPADEKFNIAKNDRKAVIYSRPRQNVLREIFIFEKK